MSLPPQLQALLQGLHHIEVTRYTQMASTCIILYDHVLTFDDEVELIWKSSWSMGKGLFLINRYYSVASVIFMNYGFFSPTLTPSFCSRFFQWQGWTGLIACIIAEVILQMRLYAMYSLNKAVLVIMVLAFLGSTATSGYVMHSVIAKITATTIDIPNGRFCMPHGVSDKFYVFWIPMLAFECLLCTLALIRGFQAFVTDGSLFRRGRELVRILLRDSVLYFLVICATYMTCLLVWIVGPITLLEAPIGFSVAFSCVLANRLILNVREINRTLDPSKPSANSRVPEKQRIPVRDSDFIEYYYGSGALGPTATMSFGNQGTLTQFEMNQAEIAERPWAPEPPSPASGLQSPQRVQFDLESHAQSAAPERPWKAWIPQENVARSVTDSARSSSELEHPDVPFVVL